VMTRFRGQIIEHHSESNTNREALYVATGLFERIVWLIRELATDQGTLLSEASARPSEI
jgi:hypothetical protein